MLLYHFTSVENLDAIRHEGCDLLAGTCPTRAVGVYYDEISLLLAVLDFIAECIQRDDFAPVALRDFHHALTVRKLVYADDLSFGQPKGEVQTSGL
jgi:hypothetical protein